MSEPLYARTFDAPSLLRDHPPQFRHPHKVALFELAYPDGIASPESVRVTRWPQHVPASFPLPADLPAEVRPDYYDYRPGAPGSNAIEWHVNFADPRLFAAYGSGLLAQDEMQVAEHPILGSVREALLAEKLAALTVDRDGATPILVSGVERRLEVSTSPDPSAGRPLGLYGNRFAAASVDVVRRAARRIDPPTFTNLIAMAAPAGGRGEYTDREIAHVFGTAFTAFDAARQESGKLAAPGAATAVHTGFWGCGAFGGNRKLMVALQALAARAAGVARLVFHAGDAAGADEARRGLDVADGLARRCGSPCALDTLVGRVALLGYRWGVGDGN